MAQMPQQHTYSLPVAAAASNHGRTPAAWLLTLGGSLAVLLFGVGLALWLYWLMITGIVVAIASVVISFVMRRMGLGQPAHPVPADGGKDWYGA